MMTLTIIKSLNEAADPINRPSRSDVVLRDEVVDMVGNEIKGRLTATIGQSIAGYVDYTTYEGKCYIDFITTLDGFERQGVATTMIDYLVKEVKGYGNILWGHTTADGTALKSIMDQRYHYVEPKRYRRLPASIVAAILRKNFVAGLFLQDLVQQGIDAFDKWDGTDWLEANTDLVNDLASIAEWVEGSKFTFYGQRTPEQTRYMPDHILPMIHRWFKLKPGNPTV